MTTYERLRDVPTSSKAIDDDGYTWEHRHGAWGVRPVDGPTPGVWRACPLPADSDFLDELFGPFVEVIETWDQVTQSYIVRGNEDYYLKVPDSDIVLFNAGCNPVDKGWIICSHEPKGPFTEV